jgi:hypothetical protein
VEFGAGNVQISTVLAGWKFSLPAWQRDDLVGQVCGKGGMSEGEGDERAEEELCHVQCLGSG